MEIEAAPGVKYAIIQTITLRDNNMLNISWLCEIAGVSRSGYYNWLASQEGKKRREKQDRCDFDLILAAYLFRGYDKGGKGIYMRFLHMTPTINMNVKKIRRLMQKYGLKCPVRRANPYRRMARAMETSYVAPNLLNREFRQHGPRKVLLTDITYLLYGDGKKCYMSTIIDSFTKQLLAWACSESLQVDFVLETVNNLVRDHGISLHTETLINSDQGSHYKSLKFIQLIKDNELRQSMSRKANCWDNAPQESFYGHMKDEINISLCTYFEEVHKIIVDWTAYYNDERYQWELARLSPNEYYNYVITGIYPLSIPRPKGGDK